jgi:pyruvate dehydrogenase E1 component
MTVARARPAARDRRPAPVADDDAVFREIADRVLWLATRMIHEANVVRPNVDGLKVGGHQASSASLVSILVALYLRWLRADDLVAVKPHAGPAYHAIQYLLGGLDRRYLTSLRTFGGLQAYPSRTKDPDRVDYSTGSVGLGAVAPLFTSLADAYLAAHAPAGAPPRPDRRFVALVGDAELDEGSIWECVLEEALQGLGNVTMVVDLNRQSLDRVVPGIRVSRLEGMFRAAGWSVIEAKYGRRLEGLFARPQGDTLRRAIDDMPNEAYQSLIRRDGTEIRQRLLEGAPAADRDGLATVLAPVPDADLRATLADLGGHDIAALVNAFDAADADRSRPSVVFAYTIKGWGLPFAGDPMNHSAQLTTEQVDALGERLGIDAADPWAGFDPDSPAGRWCASRAEALGVTAPRRATARLGGWTPPSLDVAVPATTSTQQVFGNALTAMARDPELVERVVTAAPDVAVSTGLGGWVNRVGVFSLTEATAHDHGPQLLRWQPGPTGRHVELGISEMNLFMWLGQAGLSAELLGEPLVPIGTVYDPFVARGLDALVYSLYAGSRFVLVGTPSGITLAPEGGAHQSAITTSLGVELPGIRAWDPAFGREVAWLAEEALRGALTADGGFASYLRLSTRPVDQALAQPVEQRLGLQEWRRQVIAGGYRLLEAAESQDVPAGAPVVNVVAMGSVVTEAVEAVRILQREEVAANLVVVTSADRLGAEIHERRLAGARARRGGALDHVDTLFPEPGRRAPMVTVLDGASHALAFLGGAFGAPVVPLGVDAFGQSGTIPDLYAHAGVGADAIVDAALLALELGEGGPR